MTRDVCLEQWTSPEITAAIAAGDTTVVLPCGATEQHGPHLPLSVDTTCASALAVEVARRLNHALVAPTLPLGCSEHHLAFAGSMSVSKETFAALCRDCCASLAGHGFRRILCLSWHGGNFATLSDIADVLQTAAGATCRVLVWADLPRFDAIVRSVVEQSSGLGSHVGGHADIVESSVMLHLAPELVRPERAVAGYVGTFDSDLVKRMWSDGIGAVSATGVLGNPSGMDAELGRRCLAALSDEIADCFGREAI